MCFFIHRVSSAISGGGRATLSRPRPRATSRALARRGIPAALRRPLSLRPMGRTGRSPFDSPVRPRRQRGSPLCATHRFRLLGTARAGSPWGCVWRAEALQAVSTQTAPRKLPGPVASRRPAVLATAVSELPMTRTWPAWLYSRTGTARLATRPLCKRILGWRQHRLVSHSRPAWTAPRAARRRLRPSSNSSFPSEKTWFALDEI